MANKKARATASTPKPAKPKNKTLPIMDAWKSSHDRGARAVLGVAGEDGKKIFRFAFSGAHQEVPPYDATTENRFDALIQELWNVVNNNWPLATKKKKKKREEEEEQDAEQEGEQEGKQEEAQDQKEPAQGGARFERLAQIAAQTMHSHLGKYVHPEAPETMLVAPGGEELPFLCSQSIGETRWMSAGFAHRTILSKSSLIFHAQFKRKIEGKEKIVTLPWLLANDDMDADRALKRAGLTMSEIDSARVVFKKAFEQGGEIESSRELPMLRLPSFEDGAWSYQSVIALPALGCYNAIARMRSLAFDMSMWLPTGRFSVGSGKSLNISVASSHTGGSLPLLMCEPPKIIPTSISGLLRKAGSKNGLGILTNASDEEVAALRALAQAIKPWPNANREAKMKSMARAWVDLAISQAENLARELALQEEGIQGATRQTLPQNVPSFLRAALLGLGVNRQESQEWFDALLGAEGRSALSEHSDQDQRWWRQGAWSVLVDVFGIKTQAISPQQNDQGETA